MMGKLTQNGVYETYPGMQMAWDFMDANWPGSQNQLVARAMEAYYNTKSKGAGERGLMQQEGQALGNSQIPVKKNIWQIKDPNDVRIKTKVVQKYSVYNTGSTIAYITKIASRAKRHLAAVYSDAAVGDSSMSETAMNLLLVPDEMINLTPAGASCRVNWQPSRATINSPWLMPDGSVLDQYNASTTNVFQALRMWQARMQFMPWWITRRQLQNGNGSNQTMGTSGTFRDQPGAMIGAPGAFGAPGAVDQAGTYPGSAGLSNWRFSDSWRAYRNAPTGMTQSWVSTQQAVVPPIGPPTTTEAFRLYPEFREQKKGVMDRWWHRSARRLQPLAPGSSLQFKTYSSSLVKPWRHAIPGVTSGSASYVTANTKWGLLVVDAGITTAGMGFETAQVAGSGCARAVMNQAGAQTAATPLRFVYNKKTDPLGSPCTSGVTTLIVRGNTVPHAVVAPALGGDFVDAGPAQLMVKRETFWKVKMYVKTKKERNRPYMVQNDAYYDNTSAPIESGFLNFFKTSPAQAAPVTYAQI